MIIWFREVGYSSTCRRQALPADVNYESFDALALEVIRESA